MKKIVYQVPISLNIAGGYTQQKGSAIISSNTSESLKLTVISSKKQQKNPVEILVKASKLVLGFCKKNALESKKISFRYKIKSSFDEKSKLIQSSLLTAGVASFFEIYLNRQATQQELIEVLQPELLNANNLIRGGFSFARKEFDFLTLSASMDINTSAKLLNNFYFIKIDQSILNESQINQHLDTLLDEQRSMAQKAIRDIDKNTKIMIDGIFDKDNQKISEAVSRTQKLINKLGFKNQDELDILEDLFRFGVGKSVANGEFLLFFCNNNDVAGLNGFLNKKGYNFLNLDSQNKLSRLDQECFETEEGIVMDE